jgi:hypothetical protein
MLGVTDYVSNQQVWPCRDSLLRARVWLQLRSRTCLQLQRKYCSHFW